MTPTARWGALAPLLAPIGAWGLGLGDIELSSALNQPLDAEIQLVSATSEELDSLRVSLASQETFDRYGLDRPAYLAGINFETASDNLGRPVIRVTSREPIAEPFVTVLVEASWSQGRLLREYTVLLDPPLLLPVPGVADNIQPAEAGATSASEPAAAINRPAPPPAQPTPQLAQLPSQPAAQPAPDSYGPVQEAETLWSIAARYRPAGVTTNQMMVALYRANPQAFGGNMNTLHEGATLRIPDLAELASVSAQEATQEAVRQATAWQGGAAAEQQARLRLVAPETATDSVATGTTPSAAGTADGAAAAQLESELSALRDELQESQRLIELRDQEVLALQAQLAAAQEAREALETQVAAADVEAEPEATPLTETGIDLEAEPLFADEIEPAAETEPADTAAASTSGEEPAEATTPAAARVVTTAAQPSMLARVLGWLTSPFLLIGLGLAALLGTAVWYLRYRQQDADDVTGRWEALDADLAAGAVSEAIEDVPAESSDEAFLFDLPEDVTAETPFEEAIGADADEIATDEADAAADEDEVVDALSVEPRPFSPDRDDAEESKTMTIGGPPVEEVSDDTLSSQTIINLEQADPIAEADFHMAYGLYDQAADLVEKALLTDPDRRDLKLKLLEVFFVWGNKESFLSTAEELHSEIGSRSGPDWDKVVIMGKQICPDESLFAVAVPISDLVDVDLDAGSSPDLDLSFDAEHGADEKLPSDDGMLAGADLAGDDAAEELAEDRAEESPGEALEIDEQTAAELEGAISEQPAGSGGEDAAKDAVGEAAFDDTEVDEDLAELTASLDADERLSSMIEEPAFDPEKTDTADAEPAASETIDRTGELPSIEPLDEEAREDEDARERTAEIDLDDLGLDVEDLPDMTGNLEVIVDEQDLAPLSTADEDTLASSEIPDAREAEEEPASLSDDEETELLSDAIAEEASAGAADDSAETEALESLVDIGDGPATDADSPDIVAFGDTEPTDDATESEASAGDATSQTDEFAVDEPELADALADALADTAENAVAEQTASIDLNLDDLTSALQESDTVEQPLAQSVGSDVMAGGDVGGAGSTSGVVSEPDSPNMLDPHTMTMTEVGTKLDLARAYVDMGDPDGARSILEEVLEEGDSGQQKEARELIDQL